MRWWVTLARFVALVAVAVVLALWPLFAVFFVVLWYCR